MGTIKARKGKSGSTSYQALVRRRGHPPACKTFTRLTDAKRWVQDVESGFRTGHFVNQTEATKHTLGEAIDRYIEEELRRKPLSAKKQKSQLIWFKDQLGYKLLSEITPAAISKLKTSFLQQTTSKGTLRKGPTWNRYQAALSCVFQMCCGEWEWVESNPVRRIKRERETAGRVRFLSDDERKRLLAVCKEDSNPALYPLVVLTLSTGMRRGEVRNLRWEDVDLKQGAIVLHKTKNSERRRVPVKGHALQLLREHAKVRRLDINFVFPGEHSRETGIGWDYSGRFESAVKKAGIEDFVFHDLRHSCASYLAMNGASLLEIAEVLGHKTMQMVKRYSHLAESHTATVVERMNQKIFS